MSERLNKYLAFQLGVSRREADNSIAAGHVKVNGTPAVLGGRFEEADEITFKGKPLTKRIAYTYVTLNKPIGYVSSRRQQGDNQTLYSLLPEKYHNLKPVGRLDKDSSGLLLLTDDGDFAYNMTHPKFYKVKTYEVSLSEPLQPLHQQMISDFGIQLEDGPSKLSLEKRNDSSKDWLVTMHEGRNRQIRRTFSSLGYTVSELHRISFGDYKIGELKPGEFLEINK
ncbi:MAG: pseudouridine synthase [Patescibacteria group bacterium]